MKIFDKTPFQNEQGQVELAGRLQGTLKYGTTWFPELEAQKVVMAQLERLLEKGFVLIRNFNLPGSDIIVPLILVGTHGISVLYVTHLKGFYEAKGDQWNRVDRNRSIPAPINLLNRVVRLARATQIYMERHNIPVTSVVDPVLVAADPGLNIDSMRPVARVVMSDAIKQFATSLIQNRPVMRPEQVYDLADRILAPPAPVKKAAPEPEPEPFNLEEWTPAGSTSSEPAPSRARAIFDASESAAPFDPADLSFAFDEQAEQRETVRIPGGLVETSPAQPLPEATPRPIKQPRILGMQPFQLAVLAIMFICECCILAGAIYYINLQS